MHKEHAFLFKPDMVLPTLDGRKTQTRRIPGVTNTLVNGKRLSPKAWKAHNWDWGDAEIRPGGDAFSETPYIRVIDSARGCLCDHLTPIYRPGDGMWGRETWMISGRDRRRRVDTFGVLYAADKAYRTFDLDPFRDRFCRKFDKEMRAHVDIHTPPNPWRKRVSIHMYRCFSRIVRPITDVRIERVQEITPRDAEAEGLFREWVADKHWYGVNESDPRMSISPVAKFHELWDGINAKRGWAWHLNRPVYAVTFEGPSA